MFSFVGVLTIIRCHLQLENMDWIIMVLRNYPNGLHANYKPNSNVKAYMEVEDYLVKNNYDLI
jgi:hypothetical protein